MSKYDDSLLLGSAGMKFTIEDILVEDPCEIYTREYLEELAAGRNNVTAREISQLNIPLNDRMWILSRLLWRQSPYRANRCARLFALSVTDLWDCPDIVWWYLTTGDTASREASWSASRSASRFAASAASRAAVWDASRFAASAASRSAASAASRAAVWDAVWDASSAASRAAVWDAVLERHLERHLETLVRAFETGV